MFSRNGVKIRIPEERWNHIVSQHCEMAGLREEVVEAIERPERILDGHNGEMLAVKGITDGRFVVAVYKESRGDGFLITAFLTSKIRYLGRRKQLWP